MPKTSRASREASAPRCQGQTKSGAPCQAHPGESGWCAFHDPELGQARARGRKQGGYRQRTPSLADVTKVQLPVRDATGVMRLLDVAAEDTLAQPNSALRSRALVAIAMAYLKGLEIAQLEQRMADLEDAFKARVSHGHE
jgi:hypothetical protein